MAASPAQGAATLTLHGTAGELNAYLSAPGGLLRYARGVADAGAVITVQAVGQGGTAVGQIDTELRLAESMGFGPRLTLPAGYTFVSAVGDGSYDTGEALRYLGYHAATLTLYVGVIPVAATIVLVGRTRTLDQALQRHLAVTIAVSFWSTVAMVVPPDVSLTVIVSAPSELLRMIHWRPARPAVPAGRSRLREDPPQSKLNTP